MLIVLDSQKLLEFIFINFFECILLNPLLSNVVILHKYNFLAANFKCY